MRWFGWFRKTEAAPIVPLSNRRLDGHLVDLEEKIRVVSQYERRIEQCDAEIDKWTLRKTGRAYTDKTVSEINEQIAAIKASKKKFQLLIKQEGS